MRYEEFRTAWEEALRESRLGRHGFPTETLDLTSMDRTYTVRVEPAGGQDAEPFYVTAELSWRWSALQSARTATSEEDTLSQLYGLADVPDAEAPWMRVDIKLSATLPWGKPAPLPGARAWAAWVRETLGRLEGIEPLLPKERARENDEGMLEVLAWREEPELTVACAPNGDLMLAGVTLSAGQLLTLPRAWSSPEKRDAPPHQQLSELTARLEAALRAWSEVMDHLRPPSPARDH